MTGGVSYDPLGAGALVSRWRTQASQMRRATSSLAAATTTALPADAVSAAQTFLDMWESTARKASIAADVYADELTSTGTSYQSIDAEIARRMDAMKPDAR
ncbi:hypothetical protein Q9R19_03260 [Microbacterium sp. ARD32]|uniref:hypothetical protein n=1 Tax=Microbacterium sp. ARD32 TaxID=2962577 RepID=UPI002880D743|nr:hypothetical protein [Microbacterium sp. ARD32]MDT0156638.1 hypothetical protein [Microbacterium sp. ARD32]